MEPVLIATAVRPVSRNGVPSTPAPAIAQRAGPPVALVTLTVMLGLIMAIIDASIVNVALADMAGNLGASIDEISWVVTGYILANVVVMPLNGWLTARFGRRNFYAVCLAIFTITSFLCGIATSSTELIIFRVLQGLGGGALQPTAQAILFESYPPEKRGMAMAIFGIGAMVGPALGPTLGGAIVDNFSWPLIFFINLPIGIVAFIMTLLFIRDPEFIERSASNRVDWFALGLMTVGLAALQYVLERGQRDDWWSSGTITMLALVSVVALVAFVVRELRDKAPLVDLKIFRNRSFAAGNVIGIVSGFGLFGLNLMLPLYFQNVLGFDAWQTGLALLPGAIATMISMPIAGRLIGKFDSPAIIAGGIAIFAIGSWWMGDLNQFAGYWDIFWPRAVQGFALGFLFVPLSTATLSAVPRSEMASASGLYTLVRQLGGSIGIAVLQLLQIREQDKAFTALSANVTSTSSSVNAFISNAHTHAQALQQLTQMVTQNAMMISYSYTFRACAILFVIALPSVLLLAKKKGAAEPGEMAMVGE